MREIIRQGREENRQEMEESIREIVREEITTALAETNSEVKKLKNGLAALGRNRDSSEEQEPE